MLDFHSHILPAIDDGSKSVEESLALLEMLTRQGVDTVVATPHFYADREAASSFLARRASSFAELTAALPKSAPRILLGAEVAYYSGISRISDMRSLCAGESRLLLLEMPYAKWTPRMVAEILEIHRANHVRIVLAHVDRYLKLGNLPTLIDLAEQGVLMQANASFFIGHTTRRKILKLIGRGYIQFLGSDCHNTVGRIPLMGEACALIEKKLGGAVLADLDRFPRQMLKLLPKRP